MTSVDSTVELAPIIYAAGINTSTGPTDTSSDGSTNINTSMAMADDTGINACLLVGVVVDSTIYVPAKGGPVTALEPALVPEHGWTQKTKRLYDEIRD